MASQDVRASFEGDAPAAAKTEALPDRRELALIAVERTRMPMVVSDPRQPDDPIVLANQAFLDLTGYSAEELLGRNCRFLQGKATDAAQVEAIRCGLAGGDDRIELELLNYRKDGSSFWNQLSISPVHDERGDLIYYFASQKDVTARRRAEALEATERLLLKEVDHRSMNALALVQSIVRLSRAEDIASYCASVLGRVDALARAHRLLASSNWSDADVGAIIAMETASVPTGQVTADGPEVTLPAGLVQPLTLVLHELLSNARQHGSLAQMSGTLNIGWEMAAGRLTLFWREVGASLPQTVPGYGFGLNMVTGVLARQLGGRFDPQWRDHGIEVRIEIPLQTAVRA